MKSKIVFVLLPALVFVSASCIRIGIRAPENYRKLISCKEDADSARGAKHVEKVKECIPLADSFIKNQEVYKLDQDELQDVFNALYGVYFYVKERGGRGLEEVFSRIEPKNRTTHMARNVFDSYVIERDFSRATEFARTYQEFKFPTLPKVTGRADTGKMAVFQVTGKNTLLLEEFAWPKGPAVMVVFNNGCPHCEDMHKHLTSNPALYKKVLPKVYYLMPQDGDLTSMMTWPLAHPRPTARIVYRQAPFEALMDTWSETPTVYFFNSIDLRDRMDGWSDPERFHRGLKAIGLM
jgi:hypothetical protein